VIPEESTTPGLVEPVRMALEATNLGDLDAVMSFYAPDAVWEVIGLGAVLEGTTAIRGFLVDWMGAYDEFAIDIEEIVDLGNGVALTVLVQRGRPVGSTAHVRYRLAQLSTWVDGVVVKITGYSDVDEARAAAERLAEERA
jgi:ketosteroid isomerase-like protein